ncbi:MAG: hypothetical protein R3181_13640 [Rubricoccaceae bacterium]|nr:hypothetical protein [Rubricoccaceae bacterium]
MRLCTTIPRFCAALALALALSACSPSVAPLYRDYEVEAPSAEASDDVYTRIRVALTDAGWELRPTDVPNVVSTAPRQTDNWGLYRTEVALDVAPVGEHHVRVFFHPVRYSVLGGRSKLSYLGSGLRRALLPDLNASFARQGFVVLGTPRERDEESVEG